MAAIAASTVTLLVLTAVAVFMYRAVGRPSSRHTAARQAAAASSQPAAQPRPTRRQLAQAEEQRKQDARRPEYVHQDEALATALAGRGGPVRVASGGA